MVRFSTGHNFLRRHENLVNPGQQSKLCRHCGQEEETGEHIINRCLKYTQYRLLRFGRDIAHPEEWSVESLINFITKDEVKAMGNANSE